MQSANSTALKKEIALLGGLVDLLTPGQRGELRKHFSVMRFPKKRSIYEEGQVPEQLFCLLRGKVKIAKTGIGEREQIYRVLKPVEMFGYRAYFAHENYVTTAATFEPCVIGCLPMELVAQWMETNIRLSNFFVKLLSVDLGRADQRTVSLTQKHIRGRLAEAVLFLKETYGIEEDGATLSIYLSREDLASLSNMTASNATRTLSAFAAERIVATDGRKIKILDEEALRRISQLG